MLDHICAKIPLERPVFEQKHRTKFTKCSVTLSTVITYETSFSPDDVMEIWADFSALCFGRTAKFKYVSPKLWRNVMPLAHGGLKCHDIILYSIFLPKSGRMQLHSWICSCTVFLLSGYTVARWSVNSVLCIWWNQCNSISFCATAYQDVTTSYPSYTLNRS